METTVTVGGIITAAYYKERIFKAFLDVIRGTATPQEHRIAAQAVHDYGNPGTVVLQDLEMDLNNHGHVAEGDRVRALRENGGTATPEDVSERERVRGSRREAGTATPSDIV